MSKRKTKSPDFTLMKSYLRFFVLEHGCAITRGTCVCMTSSHVSIFSRIILSVCLKGTYNEDNREVSVGITGSTVLHVFQCRLSSITEGCLVINKRHALQKKISWHEASQHLRLRLKMPQTCLHKSIHMLRSHNSYFPVKAIFR